MWWLWITSRKKLTLILTGFMLKPSPVCTAKKIFMDMRKIWEILFTWKLFFDDLTFNSFSIAWHESYLFWTWQWRSYKEDVRKLKKERSYGLEDSVLDGSHTQLISDLTFWILLILPRKRSQWKLEMIGHLLSLIRFKIPINPLS